MEKRERHFPSRLHRRRSRRRLDSSFFHFATNCPPKMNRNGELVLLSFLLLALATAYTEVVTFRSCPYADPNVQPNCTVHEVRVDPCKEAAENKPCKIKRGHDSSISFDYTTNFAGDNLQSRAYWASEVADLPFLGMDTNACAATSCPAVAGEKKTYSIQLPISKKFPVRTYDLKWKLWNEQEQECCFMFQIKLQK